MAVCTICCQPTRCSWAAQFRRRPHRKLRVPIVSQLIPRERPHVTRQHNPAPTGFAAIGISFVAASSMPAQALDLQGASLAEVVTWVGFAVAVLVLGVVTTGVAYLSISSWQDSTTEKTEREKYEKALAMRQKNEQVGDNAEGKRRSTDPSSKSNMATAKSKKGFGG